jgi:hypothetical protein
MSTRRRGSHKKIYGHRKIREMQRSVLPSDARRLARTSLAGVRRHGRRAAAAHLVTYRGAADRVIAWALDDPADLAAWPRHRIRDEVFGRRDHDKVAPLIRWARARTRALPHAERLDALSPLFPPTVIGRHALSHLERCPDLHNPAEPRSWWELRLEDARRRPEPRSILARLVRTALADGRHGDINRWLKAQVPIGEARTLAGSHEVDAFVEALEHERVVGLVALLRDER